MKKPGRRSGAAKKQQRQGEERGEAKHVRQRHERVRGAERSSAGVCGEACHGSMSSGRRSAPGRGRVAGEGSGGQVMKQDGGDSPILTSPKRCRDMYAKNFELLLTRLCGQTDLSSASYEDMTHRFKSLRGYAKLPRDRANRDAKLTTKHMVAAIFGLTSSLPGWAGHAAIVLAKLRPVGGPSASFFESATLEQAIERVLLDNEALRSLIRLSMSVSEGGNNSHG